MTHQRSKRQADLLVSEKYRTIRTDRSIDWVVTPYELVRADLFQRPVTEHVPKGSPWPIRASRVRLLLDDAQTAQDRKVQPHEVTDLRGGTTVLGFGMLCSGIDTRVWRGFNLIATPLMPARFSGAEVAMGNGTVAWWQTRRGKSVLVGITALRRLGSDAFRAEVQP